MNNTNTTEQSTKYYSEDSLKTLVSITKDTFDGFVCSAKDYFNELVFPNFSSLKDTGCEKGNEVCQNIMSEEYSICFYTTLIFTFIFLSMIVPILAMKSEKRRTINMNCINILTYGYLFIMAYFVSQFSSRFNVIFVENPMFEYLTFYNVFLALLFLVILANTIFFCLKFKQPMETITQKLMVTVFSLLTTSFIVKQFGPEKSVIFSGIILISLFRILSTVWLIIKKTSLIGELERLIALTKRNNPLHEKNTINNSNRVSAVIYYAPPTYYSYRMFYY